MGRGPLSAEQSFISEKVYRKRCAGAKTTESHVDHWSGGGGLMSLGNATSLAAALNVGSDLGGNLAFDGAASTEGMWRLRTSPL